MPRFRFIYWEDAKYSVEFDADDLEQAKKLMEEAVDVDELPASEKHWRKGSESWDYETLEQIPNTESEDEE